MIKPRIDYFLVFDTNTSYDGFERHFLAFTTGIQDVRHRSDLLCDQCVLDFLGAVAEARSKKNEIRAILTDHPTTSQTVYASTVRVWAHPTLKVGHTAMMSSVAFRFRVDPPESLRQLMVSRAQQFSRIHPPFDLTGLRLVTQTVTVTEAQLAVGMWEKSPT